MSKTRGRGESKRPDPKEQKRRKQEKEMKRAAQAAAKNGAPTDTPEYLRILNQFDLPEHIEEELKTEFSQIFHLANLDDRDERYLSRFIDARFDMLIASYPPKGSAMTGMTRQFFMGDDKQPLTEDEKRELQTVKAVLKANLTRGRGGFQQKQVGNVVSVDRSEDIEHGSGGLLDKLFG
jgi:hypothetical protein